MKKNYLTFIYKSNGFADVLNCLIISAIILTSGCAYFDLSEETVLPQAKSTNYLKAEALVLNQEFEKSIPFLNLTLKQNDTQYDAALLLSARAYDQLGQPEKVILAANELLKQQIDQATKLKISSLHLKNLAKVGIDISNHPQKIKILEITQNSVNNDISILESLKWSLDFSCDQFCISEIQYLKEIQLQYLYVIEKDPVSSERAAETIKMKYEFFHSFLNKEHLDIQFRKKIAVAILDSLHKLSILQLSMPNQGAIRAAAFMLSLGPIEKNTESWLHL